MAETPAVGWGFPAGSRKAHYFVDGMALCRRYGFYRATLEPDTGPSPDDCARCRRMLAAQQREARDG